MKHKYWVAFLHGIGKVLNFKCYAPITSYALDFSRYLITYIHTYQTEKNRLESRMDSQRKMDTSDKGKFLKEF